MHAHPHAYTPGAAAVHQHIISDGPHASSYDSVEFDGRVVPTRLRVRKHNTPCSVYDSRTNGTRFTDITHNEVRRVVSHIDQRQIRKHLCAQVEWDRGNKVKCCEGTKAGPKNCDPSWYPFSSSCKSDKGTESRCFRIVDGAPAIVTEHKCHEWCAQNPAECDAGKRVFRAANPDSKWCSCVGHESRPEFNRLQKDLSDAGVKPNAPSVCWYKGCSGVPDVDMLLTSDQVRTRKGCNATEAVCVNAIDVGKDARLRIERAAFITDCPTPPPPRAPEHPPKPWVPPIPHAQQPEPSASAPADQPPSPPPPDDNEQDRPRLSQTAVVAIAVVAAAGLVTVLG